MADAHPEALAAASFVAAACADDGVAEVVERLLAERSASPVLQPCDPVETQAAAARDIDRGAPRT